MYACSTLLKKEFIFKNKFRFQKLVKYNIFIFYIVPFKFIVYKFLSYIICMRQEEEESMKTWNRKIYRTHFDALNLKQENIQNPVQCFKLETGKYTEPISML